MFFCAVQLQTLRGNLNGLGISLWDLGKLDRILILEKIL